MATIRDGDGGATQKVDSGPRAGRVILYGPDGNAIDSTHPLSVSLAAPIGGTVAVSGAVEIANDAGNAIPVSATALPLPAGAATSAKQDTLIAALTTIAGYEDGVEGLLTTLTGKDYATSAKQDTTNAKLDVLHSDVATTLLAELQQKLEPSDLATLATAARQDTLQATLASILAAVDQLEGYTDGIEAGLANSLVAEKQAADLFVTGTAAAAAALTVTLPAVAGAFHYLCSIEISLMSAVARAGSATPVIVTTTNLPGSPAFTFGSAGAIGTVDRFMQPLAKPIKSATAGVATTFVCPVVTGGLWRVNVSYYAGM